MKQKPQSISQVWLTLGPKKRVGNLGACPDCQESLPQFLLRRDAPVLKTFRTEVIEIEQAVQ